MNKDDLIKALEKKLIKEGLLIEAGWQSFKLMSISPLASQQQLDSMRVTFFAGSQHLFSTIMHMLDPGDDPTQADLIRMDQIDAELKRFIEEYKRANNLEI